MSSKPVSSNEIILNLILRIAIFIDTKKFDSYSPRQCIITIDIMINFRERSIINLPYDVQQIIYGKLPHLDKKSFASTCTWLDRLGVETDPTRALMHMLKRDFGKNGPYSSTVLHRVRAALNLIHDDDELCQLNQLLSKNCSDSIEAIHLMCADDSSPFLLHKRNNQKNILSRVLEREQGRRILSTALLAAVVHDSPLSAETILECCPREHLRNFVQQREELLWFAVHEWGNTREWGENRENDILRYELVSLLCKMASPAQCTHRRGSDKQEDIGVFPSVLIEAFHRFPDSRFSEMCKIAQYHQNLEAVDVNGRTPLMLALKKKCSMGVRLASMFNSMSDLALKIIDALKKHPLGISIVDAVDQKGKTALMRACKNKMTNAAMAILGFADLSISMTDLSISNANSNLIPGHGNPFWVQNINWDQNSITALYYACKNDMVEVALSILNIALETVEKLWFHVYHRMDYLIVLLGLDLSMNSSSIFALTCRMNNDRVATYILDILQDHPGYGWLDNIDSDEIGKTALMCAIENDMEDVALRILSTQCHGNPFCVGRGICPTTIHMACHWGMEDVAVAILDLAKEAEGNGMDVYRLLCLDKHIYNYPPGIPPDIDSYSPTVLITACHMERSYVALELLRYCERTEIDCNVTDKIFGDTTLMIACEYRDEELALAILDKMNKLGVPIDTTNCFRQTALMSACINKMEDVALAMLSTEKHGYYWFRDNRGFAAHDYAQWNNMQRVVDCINELRKAE